jgi:hypothetical protein
LRGRREKKSRCSAAAPIASRRPPSLGRVLRRRCVVVGGIGAEGVERDVERVGPALHQRQGRIEAAVLDQAEEFIAAPDEGGAVRAREAGALTRRDEIAVPTKQALAK